ncbi:MAG: hypothetical protein EBX55_09000, partial [Betaproteobacteria bacterium]|nr:hypothetical protein [Betaproteobacteria bacterium]
GSFQLVIGETDNSIDPKHVKRVVACSGRVYFYFNQGHENTPLRQTITLRNLNRKSKPSST